MRETSDSAASRGSAAYALSPGFFCESKKGNGIQTTGAKADPDPMDEIDGLFYLDEELDLGANVDEIQVAVEAEDVDAAAGAPGVEYDGVLLGPGDGAGVSLPPDPYGGRARHEEEHERDERDGREDDEQDPAVAVHAVGERLGAARPGQLRVAAHLVGGEEEEVGRGGRAVADAAGGGRRLLDRGLRVRRGIQRSRRLRARRPRGREGEARRGEGRGGRRVRAWV